MLTTTLRRSAALGVLACALLGAGPAGVAAAEASDPGIARARAQERYYAYGDPEAMSPRHVDRRAAAAEQQGEYYTSYGEPEPIAAPTTRAPADDDSPWLIIGPALIAALVAGTAIAAVTWRRRLRIRRRAVGAMT